MTPLLPLPLVLLPGLLIPLERNSFFIKFKMKKKYESVLLPAILPYYSAHAILDNGGIKAHDHDDSCPLQWRLFAYTHTQPTHQQAIDCKIISAKAGLVGYHLNLTQYSSFCKDKKRGNRELCHGDCHSSFRSLCMKSWKFSPGGA